MNRRSLLISAFAGTAFPGVARAVSRDIWSATEAADALARGRITLIDVRSRDEWLETGIARGAWPISMHEKGFEDRLLAARMLADGRTNALICATGGRTARLLRALKRAGYAEFVDVSEGMLGSRRGPGWIARGLPVVSLGAALAEMPEDLA
jgi:rhodanese-related sulfurtransferase